MGHAETQAPRTTALRFGPFSIGGGGGAGGSAGVGGAGGGKGCRWECRWGVGVGDAGVWEECGWLNWGMVGQPGGAA
jgi:hypothetical protein